MVQKSAQRPAALAVSGALDSMAQSRKRQVLHKLLSVIAIGVALTFNLACTGVATKPPSSDQRQTLKEKVDDVIANGELDPVPAKSTRFSEAELNQILNGQMVNWIPSGVSEPQVRLLGNQRFTLRAIVDVDEFKRRRERQRNAGPLNFFSGKMPAVVRGDLVTGDGKGQLKLQSVEVNGIPLPRNLALELLATHSKTRRNPEGVDIEKPFDLPNKIRQLQINAGELVVIQ